MTKKPAALIPGDTFTQSGLRHTVIGEVFNHGDRVAVMTNVMPLNIPNYVDLKIV